MHLLHKTFENNVAKREIVHDKQFLPLQQCWLLYSIIIPSFIKILHIFDKQLKKHFLYNCCLLFLSNSLNYIFLHYIWSFSKSSRRLGKTPYRHILIPLQQMTLKTLWQKEKVLIIDTCTFSGTNTCSLSCLTTRRQIIFLIWLGQIQYQIW